MHPRERLAAAKAKIAATRLTRNPVSKCKLQKLFQTG